LVPESLQLGYFRHLALPERMSSRIELRPGTSGAISPGWYSGKYLHDVLLPPASLFHEAGRHSLHQALRGQWSLAGRGQHSRAGSTEQLSKRHHRHHAGRVYQVNGAAEQPFDGMRDASDTHLIAGSEPGRPGDSHDAPAAAVTRVVLLNGALAKSACN